MIIAIRISGLVEVPEKTQETLFRLRLRRKYSAVLLKPTPENLKLLRKIRNYIAYGDINNQTLVLLLENRARSNEKKKMNSKVIAGQLENKPNEPNKLLQSIGIKPFFRLHPPRNGIDSKIHFPIKKGVLGDNKEKINDLVRRMI